MAKWRVTNLKRSLPSGVVVEAEWECFDKKRGVEGKFASKTMFYADLNADIKPYELLTEADVLDWVKSHTDVIAVEQIVADQIFMQQRKLYAHGLPWLDVSNATDSN